MSQSHGLVAVPVDETGLFPLTCGWCRKAPADHLAIVDYLPDGKQAAERQKHMLCAPCARGVTVLPGCFAGWWLYRLAPYDCKED